jgi:hypothetical protein
MSRLRSIEMTRQLTFATAMTAGVDDTSLDSPRSVSIADHRHRMIDRA